MIMEETNKQKAIIVSGYFNPIHKGHIEYFHMAKSHGNLLFVIVNNDNQRELKGTKEFMGQEERLILVKELRIVDEAHTLGLKVAAHAHGLEGIRMAIDAGVDSIEHSSLIDQETIDLAIVNSVFLSMDIYVSDYILGEGAKNGIPEYSLEKERTVGRKQRENFKMAVKSGAKMVFGTDAGIFPHGKNARQFKYMVKWGMTPIESIQAATINTAELFGLNNIGEIKESFDADLIGVKGNPLDDITLLEDIHFVMKEGQVIK